VIFIFPNHFRWLYSFIHWLFTDLSSQRGSSVVVPVASDEPAIANQAIILHAGPEHISRLGR
jgi:hypothetical protein